MYFVLFSVVCTRLFMKYVKNLQKVEDMEIGEATRNGLSKEQYKRVLLDMRKFLSTIVLTRDHPFTQLISTGQKCWH